jgi:hypothetical protein
MFKFVFIYANFLVSFACPQSLPLEIEKHLAKITQDTQDTLEKFTQETKDQLEKLGDETTDKV